MEGFDVVVIGGGLAGLCAAVRAREAGARVALLERASTLGGRAASRSDGGFVLNQGPHALYLGGAAARMFREMGIAWRGTAPKSPYFFLESGGALHAMPTGGLALMRTSLLDLSDKLTVARVLATLGNGADLDTTSAADFIRRCGGPGAQALLSALVRVSSYCADHDALSAGAAVRQLRLALRKGVTYLDGGWQSLVDALYARAHAAGVHLRADAAVKHLSYEDGGYSVEWSGGERIFASAAILAVGPRTAHALVPTSTALATAARESVPMFAACLDVNLRALPNARHHLTLGMDRADYLSVHSAFADIAPKGSAVIHVARYLKGDEGEGEDAARVRGELEGLLSRAQPDWESLAVYTRFLPRMTVSNALPRAANGGARAAVSVPDSPSLYLAGDWVGNVGMLLDTAIASACEAAAAATRNLKVRGVA